MNVPLPTPYVNSGSATYTLDTDCRIARLRESRDVKHVC